MAHMDTYHLRLPDELVTEIQQECERQPLDRTWSETARRLLAEALAERTAARNALAVRLQRRAALDQMTREADELGLYDEPDPGFIHTRGPLEGQPTERQEQ